MRSLIALVALSTIVACGDSDSTTDPAGSTSVSTLGEPCGGPFDCDGGQVCVVVLGAGSWCAPVCEAPCVCVGSAEDDTLHCPSKIRDIGQSCVDDRDCIGQRLCTFGRCQ